MSNKDKKDSISQWLETRNTNLSQFSLALKANTPKAEKAFKFWWQHIGMEHSKDLYNTPLGMFIPDIHNPYYKYVIEIDEKHHKHSKHKAKDLLRDVSFRRLNYTVIRIQANSLEDIAKAARQVLEIRLNNESLWLL